MKETKTIAAVAVAILAVAALGYGVYRMVDAGSTPSDDGTDGGTSTNGVHVMAYTDESGDASALSAFKGKWLVLDLTGTTCVYCPAQYDELRMLRATVPASSVAILTVEVWGASLDEMAETASEEGVTWEWGIDRGGAFAAEWGTTVPRIVVVDPYGNVAYEFPAGFVSREDIRAQIDL